MNIAFLPILLCHFCMVLFSVNMTRTWPFLVFQDIFKVNLTFLWTCHKQTYAIVINKHMQSFKSPFTVHKYLWTFEGFESYHTSFSKALKAIIQVFSKALKAIIQILRMLWKLFFRFFLSWKSILLLVFFDFVRNIIA